jgi:hypothetical protein
MYVSEKSAASIIRVETLHEPYSPPFKSTSLVHVLNQVKYFHIFMPYFCKINFNIAFLSRPRFFKWLLFRLSKWILNAFLITSRMLYALFIAIYLIMLIITDEAYNSWGLSSCSSLHSSLIHYFLLSSTLCSHAPKAVWRTEIQKPGKVK